MSDPFEGLPPHMVESVPLTVEVTVQYPPESEVWINGERHEMLDGIGRVETHRLQLERGGRPLTMADRKGWAAGEVEGWRAWSGPKHESPPGVPQWDVIDIEAEEVHE